MQPPRRRPALLLLAALAALVALARIGQVALDRLRPAPEAAAPLPRVEVVVLRPRPFERTVPVSGTLEPARSADVYPKVGGRVVRLPVRLGQRVRAGETLAVVETTELELVAEKAAEGREAAERAAEIARGAWERVEAVRERAGEDALGAPDVDRARAEAIGAEAQAEIARIDAALARRMLDNARMTAPFDGVVSAVRARLGGMVGKALPAFTVVDPSSFVLRCEVGEADLPAVAPGQPVRLRAALLPGVELAGTVAAVSPALDAWTRRAPVEIEVPAPQGAAIPGNLLVRGEIVVQRTDDALVVPLEALTREPGSDEATVKVVRDGVVEEARVRVRAERQGEVAIEGLEAGAAVLLPGPVALSPGERVEPVERGAAGAGAAGGP